jgi:HEAT repeat protein/energy-coupling factor transporter ATP-binding protein EcfA2
MRFSVRFAGIAVEGQDIDQPGRLVEIFVMPDVEEEDSQQQGNSEEMPIEVLKNAQQRLLWEQRQQMLRAKQQGVSRKFSAADLLRKGKSKRVVMLGAPGSGKTTLLNYFAVVGTASNGEVTSQGFNEQYSSEAAPHLKTVICLPIIIRIRDLALNPDLSILEYIQEFTTKDLSVGGDLTGFFEYYLENGNALILLDGLDEVADVTQRYKVVEKIEAFLNHCENCFAIISSRPAGYRRDFFRTDEYPHYELQPFDDEKIDIFIEHWYDSRFELVSERERRKASLRKALKEQPRIKQLARNPLLLTIIALIHRYQARLPKERYKLYDKAVETLLTTWDSHKELSNHEILEYLELDDLRRLMERLAYWIHCQGGTGDTEGGTLIDRDELITQLTQYIQEIKQVARHQAKAEAKRFLEQIVRDRAGLLSLQGQDRYAFVHKTFQEYLTAMEIRDQQEEGFDVVLDHLETHLHDPHWEEVLLLLIAQQKRNNPKKILDAVLNHNTPYEQWLHRNLLFSGLILSEDVPIIDNTLVDRILGGLLELEASQSHLVIQKLRDRIFKIFGNLHETAFEKSALRQLDDYRNKLERGRFLTYQAELTQGKDISASIALLRDEAYDESYDVRRLLVDIGKDSEIFVSSLLELLEDEDADVRSRAAWALGEVDEGSEAVVQSLLKLLKDEDADVRSRTARALGDVGKGSEAVVSSLLKLLKDEDADVRSRAVSVLGEVGEGSEAVISSLLKLLEDEDADVRSSTARALGDVGKGSEAVVSSLLKLLKDKDSDVRYSTARALRKVDEGSEAVVQSLLELFKDGDAGVRSHAVSLLEKVDKSSEAVVSSLLELLKDEDSDVRSRAARALREVGKSSEAIVQNLLELLKDKDADVRSSAVSVLGEAGKGAKAVVSSLLELLKDEDANVRSHAAWALGEVDEGSEAIILGLLELLKDEDPFVLSCTVATLKNLCRESTPDMISNLKLRLKDNDSVVRSLAATALGDLNIIPDAIYEDLLIELNDEDKIVRYCAVNALAKQDRFCSECISILLEILNENNRLGILELRFNNNHNLIFPIISFNSDEIHAILHRSRYVVTGIVGGDLRWYATQALSEIAKQSSEVETLLDQWLAQHHSEECAGNYVDALWEIVV